MAIFLIMLFLVLLFTAGLTLWIPLKTWRPVGALLMLLPMAICGILIFSMGTTYSTTETVALFNPDSPGSQESRGESVVATETRTEVDMYGVVIVACLGVLFISGLLVWGTMFLAWLRQRGGPQTPQVQV